MGRMKDRLQDAIGSGLYDGPQPCDDCKATGITNDGQCIKCSGSGSIDEFMDGLCRNGKNMKDCDCC